jgi:hypothetical protein
MIMYKLLPPDMFGNQLWILRISDFAQIRANGDGSDAVLFREQINADEAQLQDADGNTMTQEQAEQFIKELP